PSWPGIPSRAAPASFGTSSEAVASEIPKTAVATTIEDHFPRLVRNDLLLRLSSFFFFLSSISCVLPTTSEQSVVVYELANAHEDRARNTATPLSHRPFTHGANRVRRATGPKKTFAFFRASPPAQGTRSGIELEAI